MSKRSEVPALEGGLPVRDNYLIFGSPFISDEDIKEVVDTLKSGWLSTGPRTQKFEAMFAEYAGARHALALNSCTAGLHLALIVLGIGPGDEVITSPMTFTATANVIVHTGARPVFADIDRRTMNIDPEDIARRITPKTKAIMPVHFAGRPCDMDPILEIARDNGLYVVEDAAHAIEAVYKGKKIGSLADITAFSFYVTKNIAMGEGGIVTTDSEELCDQMRIRSLHGMSKNAWKRYTDEGFQLYDTVVPGFKYNMMDIQAALGIHQFSHIADLLAVRDRHWRRYSSELASDFITVPIEQDDIRHARHLYTILIDTEALGISRDTFAAALQAENIGIGIHFISLHLHSYYRNTFGYSPGDFPNAEFVSDRTLSIPLSAKLTDKDVTDVIEAVKKIVNYYSKNKKT